MKHYGDITKINGAEAPVVDIITGGSPCQDLSVAGKRAGLAGERSGLFMEQIRIVKEMRERERATGRTGWMVRPRYMVWENVPGAFSSGNPKGADFAAVIEEIIKVAEPGAAVSVCVPNGGWTKSGCYHAEDGSWSIAWRVHDAQFWGVPQRRKRIALVADFGGLSAPEILFERKGLSGDFETGGTPGEETAGAVGGSAEGARKTAIPINTMIATRGKALGRGTGFGVSNPGDPAFTISAAHEHAVFCLDANENGGQSRDSVLAISFQERAGKPGGGKGILVQHEHVATLNNQSVLQIGCDVYNQEITGEVAASLTAASGGTNTSGPKVFCLQGNGIDRADTAGCNGRGWREDQCYTLNTMHDQQAVLCYGLDCEHNAYKDQYGTMRAHSSGGAEHKVMVGTTVRRLTPLECERLQGYPDGWTDIGEWVDSKGKKHKDADSPRYKALGNSIALPFWQWMAKRISAQYERTPTMASLFDGIGGFPLVFQRCGAVPVWASEIEEFPIAVTKVRFPDESV